MLKQALKLALIEYITLMSSKYWNIRATLENTGVAYNQKGNRNKNVYNFINYFHGQEEYMHLIQKLNTRAPKERYWS